jgi:hypothetical protein
MKELTHKEKLEVNKRLKENLFFHLDQVFTGPPVKEIRLGDDVKRAVWRKVGHVLQSSYQAGYLAGQKKGFVDGIMNNVKKEIRKIMKKE